MTSPVRITVVDYGAGNLVSIHQALRYVGADVVVATDGPSLEAARPAVVVVPGVGAARPAMRRLQRTGLVRPVLAWIRAGRPFLGICLGSQLLFEGSAEDGATTLGVLAGRAIGLIDAPRLPHIGWNQVDRVREHPLFDGIDDGADFYFVHSFAGEPDDEGEVLARTTHGRRFASAVGHDLTVGVQFHPERSGPDGLALLANVVAMGRAA